MLTFWFEFASTYSYLAASRICALSDAAGVEVRWRPLLLGPIFKEQGWSTSPFNIYEAKGVYMWRDIDREAAKLGMPPVVRPDPFPQNGLLAARVASVGLDEPWGPEFVKAVFMAQFAEGQTISDTVVLTGILNGLGLRGQDLLERALSDEQIKASLRIATDKARSVGIFGAPSFVTSDNELFWGNDRLIDALEWEAGRLVSKTVVPPD